MPLEKAWYTRQEIRANRDKLYVFGDNFAGYGKKGQAKEARDEPNAIGIPTKRRPAWDEEAYLTDADWIRWLEVARPRWDFILEALKAGRTVVFPQAGIGTGLGELEQRAPMIYAALLEWVAELEELANSR